MSKRPSSSQSPVDVESRGGACGRAHLSNPRSGDTSERNGVRVRDLWIFKVCWSSDRQQNRHRELHWAINMKTITRRDYDRFNASGIWHRETELLRWILSGVEEKSVWTLKAKYVSFNNTAQVVAVLFYVLILIWLIDLFLAYNGLCFAA